MVNVQSEGRCFSNTYYVMRHGQSEANQAGLIVSDPVIGCAGYGLTAEGERQAKQAVQEFSGKRPTQVICSDFLRARQTAALAAQGFGLPAPQLNSGLRERFFGRLDGEADNQYPVVWQRDAEDAAHTDFQVESTLSVLQRGLALLRQLEQRYQDETLLLVSHGDTLQILQTAFSDLGCHQHRQLPHLNTAQIKCLVRRGEALPASLSNVQANVTATT